MVSVNRTEAALAEVTSNKLIESIPDPRIVRSRLAQTLRDAKLLRRMLKLSEQAAKDREGRREVANGR